MYGRRQEYLYYETLDWLTYARYFFRNQKDDFLKALRAHLRTDALYLTNAARSGIIVGLRAAGRGRHDEIFIPPFLSACVLDALNRGGFPALRFSEKTRAVLLYHHWGFPQNFPLIRRHLEGRDVFVLEDCAHGFWGRSNGFGIGEFGDMAVFSLPKIFPITYAGLVRVNAPHLREEVERQLRYRITFRERWQALKGERTYVRFYMQPPGKRARPDYAVDLQKWYVTLMTHPACKGIRGRLPRSEQDLRAVFKKQNGHFRRFLEAMPERTFMLEGDEPQTMAPLCFPFIHPDRAVLEKADAWLKARGVMTGIYHFDVQRNMFQPEYRPCLPVPLYASMDEEVIKSFIKTFK
jgi:hypothetical protein